MRADIPMPHGLRFRVLPQERQTIERAARKHGLTLSEFIRQAVAAATGNIAA